MKEANMVQPNSLGHYHRDIVSAVSHDRYYMMLALSCGHKKLMSKAGWKKYHDSATLCTDCK